MRRARVAFPRWALALAAGWVLVLHPVLQAISAPLWLLGILDWSGHLATAVLLLANLPVALRTPVTAAALAASMLIDVDHVPQYLGTDVLTEGTPRPYGHSLATVLVAAAAAAVLRGRARQISAGIALGVLAHLFRDVSTGGGIAPLWPLSDAALRLPFWLEAAALGVLATRAWMQARRLPHATDEPPPSPPVHLR